MKLFYKLLLILIILFVAVVGPSIYFYYTSMHKIIDVLSKEIVTALSMNLKNELQPALDGMDVSSPLTLQQRRFFSRKLDSATEYHAVEDFYLVDRRGKIIFSLNRTATDNAGELNSISFDSIRISDMRMKIKKMPGSGLYESAFLINTTPGVAGVVNVNTLSGIQDTIHDLTIKVYLIGFGGIVGIILIALVGSGVTRSPLKDIEKAMVNIINRKYGFRLKKKSDTEYANVYSKVNLALRRLEQLDAAQRRAVQKRNVLQREMKTTSRFLDIMAHEIKNPLHALVINLDVLKTKIEKKRPKTDTLKHTKILEQEMEHLQEVVQGFLRYVRPGVPQKEKINVNASIKEACEMVAPEAQKNKIKIETRLGKSLREISVDKRQLQQALHNVMINAIHASSQGGKVAIRSWGKRSKILVSVKDEGTGIPKDQLKKIFDLYYTTKKDGSGIGLPITKRIVEANGGQVQLESTVGKGATVTFIFPTS